jgi:hypothetical protein
MWVYLGVTRPDFYIKSLVIIIKFVNWLRSVLGTFISDKIGAQCIRLMLKM